MYMAPARCAYCQSTSSWKEGEPTPTTFNLEISASRMNPNCNHLEKTENWWWFCSPKCISRFFEFGSKNLQNQVTYQDMSLKWTTKEVTHDEFREAVECVHKKWPGSCMLCTNFSAEKVIETEITATSGQGDGTFYLEVEKPDDFNEDFVDQCGLSGSGDWWLTIFQIYKADTVVEEDEAIRFHLAGTPPDICKDDENIIYMSYVRK